LGRLPLLLDTRCEVLREKIPKANDPKNKNGAIINGPDFGNVNRAPGKIYMKAVDRYDGLIYNSDHRFKEMIAEKCGDGHKMLIISGLYGLLHPFDLIQNYEFKMSSATKRWKKALSKIFPQYLQSCGKFSAVIGFFPKTAPERRVFIDMCHTAMNQGFKGKMIRIFTQKGYGQAKQLNQAGKLILYMLGYNDVNPDPNAEFNYEVLQTLNIR
jgi:cytoplasmic iron level regulating protein YaaA (DUF328/UPF0246 family)